MSVAKVVQKIKSEIAFYKSLAKDTEGASGIEYAIVAAMVAVVIAGLSLDGYFDHYHLWKNQNCVGLSDRSARQG